MNLQRIKEKAKYERDKIIQHCKGPAIVIAGPGSGKTTTLAEKLVNLCQKDRCDTTRIIAVTFTNHAVNEMKKKLEEICKKLNYELPDLYVKTMHSLAKGLLHRYLDKLNLPPSFRIVGKPQEKLLIEDVRWELKKQNVNVRRYQNRYLIRFKASSAFVPNSYLNTIVKIPFNKGMATQVQFNECYRSLLNYYHSVDWYDVVELALKLLCENKGVLDEVADKVDHLLVDEYQDLNLTDHELIRLLSTKAKSLMVFGDDDQSIYQTGRFANPGGVKRFKEIYQKAQIYPLSVGWRCGASIIAAAWKLIDVDENLLPERMSKEKPISNPKRGAGQFGIKSFKSEKAEIQGIYEEIKSETEKRLPPKEILILFHSKDIGQKYADALQSNGIKIENLLVKSQTASEPELLLYEMLRLVNDESDNLATRFLLQELFKIKPQGITKARCMSQKQNKFLWQTVTEMDDTKEMLRSWSDNFERWRQMDNVIEITNEIVKTLEIESEPEIERIFVWCNQEQNLTLHKLIDCLEKGIDFDEASSTETAEADGTRIIIMTMHGAKGLNSDVAFVPALEDELMPNQWYEPEQRRLLYVSMTRAKRRLLLSWAWSRIGKATYRKRGRAETHRKRSRFLNEIESR